MDGGEIDIQSLAQNESDIQYFESIVLILKGDLRQILSKEVVDISFDLMAIIDPALFFQDLLEDLRLEV